ncbi:hypothetical protein NE237_023510 [Protea cynaroides]|uniref:Uncharacterized protein n=1 Tax=Protea cynaroides TaxID=273540 RepID=A0A9Q0K581_9MAGN|nr:hypothetical protein NE237_023510 [Protea cynaroides]
MGGQQGVTVVVIMVCIGLMDNGAGDYRLGKVLMGSSGVAVGHGLSGGEWCYRWSEMLKIVLQVGKSLVGRFVAGLMVKVLGAVSGRVMVGVGIITDVGVSITGAAGFGARWTENYMTGGVVIRRWQSDYARKVSYESDVQRCMGGQQGVTVVVIMVGIGLMDNGAGDYRLGKVLMGSCGVAVGHGLSGSEWCYRWSEMLKIVLQVGKSLVGRFVAGLMVKSDGGSGDNYRCWGVDHWCCWVWGKVDRKLHDRWGGDQAVAVGLCKEGES